jgi:hypothetical protein
MVWEEGGRSKEGLSEVYGGGDNSGEPSGWELTSSFRDNGAMGKGDRDVNGGGGAVIGCLHVCHFQDFA